MRKRYLFGSGLVLLAILLALVVWQVSFNFGEYGPANTAQTFVFWAVSTLIFLLTVTLGFMLFRTGVKLYIRTPEQPRRLAHQNETGAGSAGAEPAAGRVPGRVQLRRSESHLGQMVQPALPKACAPI